MAKIIPLCHSLFACVCEIHLISEGYHSAVFKIKEVESLYFVSVTSLCLFSVGKQALQMVIVKSTTLFMIVL